MIKTIMVACDRTEACAGRIALATGLAGRFDARMTGVAAHIIDIPLYAGHRPMMVSDLERQALVEIDEVRRTFDRAKVPAGGTDWRQALVDPAHHLNRQSRAADLIVIGRRGVEDQCDHQMGADPGEVILGAGRPILVVPPSLDTLRIKSAAVAWKDTREARRAVRDALPLLRLADEVHIVEITSAPAAPVGGRDVADWLAEHGVAAEPHAYEASGLGAGLSFLDRASRFEADLVVAGGYGSTRLREFVFGGFTRDLLQSSDVCCLVSN